MENNTNMIDSLLEKTSDLGKTSFELVKMKALSKSTDIVSSLIPNTISFLLFMLFLLFLSLGFAFLLGETFGKIYYGLFLIASFYGILTILLHFIMHKRFKRFIRNFLIKEVLK